MAFVMTILAAVGVLLTSLQVVLTALFRGGRRFFGGGLQEQAVPLNSFPPAVSILKPLCGLEDDLEGNLESFTRLTGLDYEVIASVADPNDPAIPIVRRVMERCTRIRLVIGGDPRLENGNRKVARLIAAEPFARAEIVVISDSNVRVEPDDVVRTLAAFRDPNVGCVSNLFTGAGAASFGASIESLHLLSFVVPGSVLAASVRAPCVVGKSMAISRRALRAIGGFARFARVLAEDQAIGLAVREAGYRVLLSPVVVRNIVVRRTLGRALARQVRWNKIRFAFSRSAYAAEFLLNPLPLAILAAVSGGRWLFPFLVVILRIAQVAVLGEATAAGLRARELILVPLLDLMQFGAQFVPFAGNRITWRGYTVRLGRNTVLLDAAETRSAAA